MEQSAKWVNCAQHGQLEYGVRLTIAAGDRSKCLSRQHNGVNCLRKEPNQIKWAEPEVEHSWSPKEPFSCQSQWTLMNFNLSAFRVRGTGKNKQKAVISLWHENARNDAIQLCSWSNLWKVIMMHARCCEIISLPSQAINYTLPSLSPYGFALLQCRTVGRGEVIKCRSDESVFFINRNCVTCDIVFVI